MEATNRFGEKVFGNDQRTFLQVSREYVQSQHLQNSKPWAELSPPHLVSHTLYATPATAKSLQSCPTLRHPIPGILQARTLEWVAFPSPMHKSEK